MTFIPDRMLDRDQDKTKDKKGALGMTDAEFAKASAELRKPENLEYRPVTLSKPAFEMTDAEFEIAKRDWSKRVGEAL